MNYIFAVIAVILTLVILKFILKLSIKIFMTLFILIALSITVVIIFVQPKMHKEFNFNIIERMIKFNDDGSTSIIETTTTSQRETK